jgi:large subunit ribosomal protein L6
MSRTGKKPIEIPNGVGVLMEGKTVKVKGPKGELNWQCPEGITVTDSGAVIIVGRENDSKTQKALHGLTRSVISNMVTGVTTGYQKVLDIVGVGYKAQVSGDKLLFTLGYSHPIEIQLPEGIKALVDAKQVQITLTGIDKHMIGQFAANVKDLRLPDAYKGKGIRDSGQRIKLKVGKAGKK